MPLKRRAYELCAVLVALAIVITAAVLLSRSHNFLLANGQPVFGDFITFWSASRAVLDGHAAQVHDGDVLFRYHQQAVPGVRYLGPWNSPPTFLLVVTPLALLPYPVAALVFLALSSALYFFAARKLLPDTRAMIFAFTLPAAVYQIGSVQIGLAYGAITGLALHWLDKRPRLAGALVGLLAIKPHLAILWPLLLALSRRWRAFAAAAASTLAFVVLAGLVFGLDAYARFFANLTASEALISGQRIATPAYASLYGNLLEAGAPQVLAVAAQALSATAAVLIAAWIFRRGAREAAGAALCAATLLISPYLFFYDFVMLAAGAALLGLPRDRFELAAAIMAWSAALSLVVGYVLPMPICAAAAWVVLLAAFRRARSAASALAPMLHT